MQRIIECVPNFSEGRDAGVIERIAQSVRDVPGATILDLHSDAGHNRSVLTFAGEPEAVQEAAVRLVGRAAELIDMNRQHGAHPRIGAADVVPFVPVAGVSMYDCVQLAHAAGQRMFQRFGVPIYFYEAAALRPECRALEDIRRGGYEQLRELVSKDVLRRPDLGGARLHPTAGATVVGAREFLVAFNVNLATSDVSIARTIARRVRSSGGGLPALKAIGVLLEDAARRPRAQVAMNLTDFTETSLPAAYEAVLRQARHLGVAVVESELVGLAPQEAFAGVDPRQVGLPESAAGQILERRMASLLPEFAP